MVSKECMVSASDAMRCACDETLLLRVRGVVNDSGEWMGWDATLVSPLPAFRWPAPKEEEERLRDERVRRGKRGAVFRAGGGICDL